MIRALNYIHFNKRILHNIKRIFEQYTVHNAHLKNCIMQNRIILEASLYIKKRVYVY